MSELLKTPLHAEHVKRGARMVPFAGYSMPVQYTGILDEYNNVRDHAGLFDVSHMGQIRVTGKNSQTYLRFLLTNDIALCKKGQAMYSPMCYPDGGVIDDLIVNMIDEHHYLVCVNASNIRRDFDWMKEQVRELEVELKNESDETSLLALQGPNAEVILSQLLPQGLPQLPFRGFLQSRLLNHEVLIARTGYTGEDGFEIYIPNAGAVVLWNALLECGAEWNLRPAGLGSRDLLRLEMGYALYGHELDEKHSPLSSGLKWAVKMENHDFVGRDALEEQLTAGCEETLVYFSYADRRSPRAGYFIFVDNREVGVVVSGAYSPRLNAAIGSGFIRWNTLKNGPVPQQINIQIRDQMMNARVVAPPFMKNTSLKSRSKKG